MMFDQDIFAVSVASLLLALVGIFLFTGLRLLAVTSLDLMLTLVMFSGLLAFVLNGVVPKFKPPIPLILFVPLLVVLSALRLGVASRRVQLST